MAGCESRAQRGGKNIHLALRMEPALWRKSAGGGFGAVPAQKHPNTTATTLKRRS